MSCITFMDADTIALRVTGAFKRGTRKWIEYAIPAATSPQRNVYVAPRTPDVMRRLLAKATEQKITFADGVREQMVATIDKLDLNRHLSSATSPTTPINSTLTWTLRPYQEAGVEYLLRNKRVLLADDTGIGKTIQAVAAAVHADATPMLVVAPAAVCEKWVREIRKGAPNLTTVRLKDGTLPTADAWVVSYASLHRYANQLAGRCATVIADEAHYAKTPHRRRTQALLTAAQGATYRFALTATPVINKTGDLIEQLRFLGRLDELGGEGFLATAHTYKINAVLRETCMIRREKRDVLHQLPPLKRRVVKVAADLSDYRREVSKTRAWASAAGGTAEAIRTDRAGGRAHTIRSFRALGVAKTDVCIKYISKLLATTDRKVVAFAHHRDVQAALAHAFTDCAVITGGQTPTIREANVHRFQTDHNCRVIIVSMAAGGVGIDLFAGSHGVFCELAWTPAALDQAEGRMERYGQMRDMVMHYLVAPDTLDDHVMSVVRSKRAMSNGVLGGNGAGDPIVGALRWLTEAA